MLLPSGGGELALLRGGDARLATCLALAHRVVNVAALLERCDERLLVSVLLELLALLLLAHLLRAAHALMPGDGIGLVLLRGLLLALLLVLRNVRLVQRLVVREPRQGMLDIDLVHEMEGCVSRAHVLMSSNSSR